MNIKKITIFSIYIFLILVLLFKQSKHVKTNDDQIRNVQLYNDINKKLNTESEINYDLSASSNKYVRIMKKLVKENKISTDVKNLKIGLTKIPTRNKFLSKIQDLHNITLMKITDNFENVGQIYDDKLLNIVISLSKAFKLKLNGEIRTITECYYDSNVNAKLEFNSDVLFVQVIKSYGNSYVKNSIINKYQQLKN